MSDRLRVIAFQSGILVIVLVAWESACQIGKVDPKVLPAFTDVVAAAARLLTDSTFLDHMGATAGRVAGAFAIGAPLAIFTGFFVGERAALNERASPALNVLLAIPQSMLLPVFILLFGVGNVQKIVFGITHIYFVLVLTTIAAVQSVPPMLVVAARSFGANATIIYRSVYLPAMLPQLLNGIRMAVVFDVVGVLLAEMYASQSGLGFLMVRWGEDYRMNELLGGVLLISVGTVAFNEAMRAWESRSMHNGSAK